MYRKELDREHLAQNEDWDGTCAAFTCPLCGKVFIVHTEMHKDGRKCPACERSTGHVHGSRKGHGTAWLEWS